MTRNLIIFSSFIVGLNLYALTDCEMYNRALRTILLDNPQLGHQNLTVCDSSIDVILVDPLYCDYRLETEYKECLHELFPLHENVTNVLFFFRPTIIGLRAELFSTEQINSTWIHKCTNYTRMTWFGESTRYEITFDNNGNAVITRKYTFYYN